MRLVLLALRSAGRIAGMAKRTVAAPDDLDTFDRNWSVGVARKVRGRLAEHEKTQHDVAVMLGLSQTAVSRRLKGSVYFSVPELARIAFWLRVPLVDLLPPECAVRDSNPEPAD